MGAEPSNIQGISPERHMIEGKALSTRSSVYRNQAPLFHRLSSCITKHSLKPLFSLWPLNMYYQAQS